MGWAPRCHFPLLPAATASSLSPSPINLRHARPSNLATPPPPPPPTMAAAAAWADLPLDLLVSILRRLPATATLPCSAVCSAWRSAVRLTLHPSVPRPPLLMLPSSTLSSSATLFTIPSDKPLTTTRLPDPPIGERLWIGSSAGYLVTADLRSELLLLNPLTHLQLRLPSIATLPHVSALSDTHGRLSGYRYSDKILPPDALRFHLLDKAIVAGDPLTVLLILDSTPKLAFAKVGDEAWTTIHTSRAVHDVVFHKGLFYSIDVKGTVEAYDLSGHSPRVAAVLPEMRGHGVFVDKYLVESSGRLLQVWRMTGGFRVFELDRSGNRWVEMRSLGDRVLFLGNNHSMALSSREFPELRENCIYFTETGGLFQSEGCGNWVFSFDDGKTRPYYHADSGSDWPLPIWIMPCLS